ncbi:MAG TPA: ABC transporter ATP-binding protein [Chloroflexota bacterium]|nr:ABC transporter ATP-binding protein [Chloroflexota bacterium]
MSAPAVRLEGVSKRFTLRHERTRSFQELWVNAFRRRGTAEEFWALRDVSFEVQPGRPFGIVGENGSGKSTALKIIAGILRPTAGTVAVNGRLAALLELGAGFHPDLTGRENIFLNASVLGFSRAEIERRFDAMVDFAELERFIDTPLKHYSSGMTVRLGFAIAINSDPDILITDEVLSVGDEAFQRKCIDRIDDLIRHGKTIILVSHGLDLVRYVCSDAIWLDHGRVRAAGSSLEVIDAYLAYANEKDRARRGAASAEAPMTNGIDPSRRWGSREVEITRVELLGHDGEPTTFFETGRPMRVRIHYHARERTWRPVFGLGIHYGEHVLLTGPNTKAAGLPIDYVDGPGHVDYLVKALPLLRGLYHVSAAVYDEQLLRAYDHHDRTYPFHVQQTRVRENIGMLWLDADWSHQMGGDGHVAVPAGQLRVEG